MELHRPLPAIERTQAAMRQSRLANNKAQELVTREPVTVYVALGANLGDAMRALQYAVKSLGELPLTRVTLVSSVYRTAPVNNGPLNETPATGPDYLNAVVSLETGLNAHALLEQLQRLEQQAGRQRPYRNAPRTLDLDLLLYGSACIESARLQVPHPRMMQRAFVLVPLAEIAPSSVSTCALAAVSHQAVQRLGSLAD